MSKRKNNFYVVWAGHVPGIYSDWDKCHAQISGFTGARYKGFATREEAQHAYECGYEEFNQPARKKSVDYSLRPQEVCICVDAACSGNPGKMEYQGVWCQDGQPIFREGPFNGATNNIGEFIAIVHGLSWLKKNNMPFPLYSDSATALAWLRNKKAKTKLERTSENVRVFQLLQRAEEWLKENPVHNQVRKWETDIWGEIPADFGRK
jgi:ribonuclease HI